MIGRTSRDRPSKWAQHITACLRSEPADHYGIDPINANAEQLAE